MSSQNGAAPPQEETYTTPPGGGSQGYGDDYGVQEPPTASVPPQGGRRKRAEKPGKDAKAERPEKAPTTEADGEAGAPLSREEKLRALTSSLWRVVAVGLAAVITVPTVMSGIHLIDWAQDEKNGLKLHAALSWLPIVTLDGTTIVCIAMVTMAALRREHGGAFHVMSWVMALLSCGINLKYGLETPQKGDEYYYPIMSLTGPVVLEFTLAFLRRWMSIDAGLRFQGVAMKDFGKRLRPGVARRETLGAWKASQREGITDPREAIRHYRETVLLRTMSGSEALRLAFDRVGSRDVFEARLWLLGRDIEVSDLDVREAVAPRDVVDVIASGQPEGLTAPEVAAAWVGKDATPADIERIRRELDSLVADGRIVADGKGSRGKAVRYRLAGVGA